MKLTNRIYHSLFTAMLAIAAASCTDDFQPEPSASRILLPGEYRFIICQDDEGLGSRVMYEDEKHSRFETGDRIGVFAEDETQIQNDVFSAKSIAGEDIQVLAPPQNLVSGLLNTIPPESGKNGYTFYFPLNPEWKRSDLMKGTGFSYAVEADQSTKENYQKSDFLWHYMNPKPDVETQTVAMHHLMANIVVKIHKDSIDTSEDPTTGKPKGVTLRNIKLTASAIYLDKQKSGEMNYKINDNQTPSDIKMYCQGESGDYLVYRAAIPAWTTISADSEIFTVNLFDRTGKSEEVTYKLAGDLSLKDGHYYTFTLRSAVKPPVEDVGDDDSWVLDVFDPRGNRIGLLCREYIYFCPTDEAYKNYTDATQNWSGSTQLFTTDRGKTYQTKRGERTFPFCINSQAWVFYNLQPNGIYPELTKGRVLRIIYDLGCVGGLPGFTDYKLDANIASDNYNGKYSNYKTTWPAPHINTAGFQGIFLMKHGHEWDTSGLYGESTAYNPGVTSTEYYMHGSEVIWDPSKNRISEFNMVDYEGNDLKITNNEAYFNGHIAMPTEESIAKNGLTEPYVSFEAFDEKGIDESGAEICTTKPHVITDARESGTIEYPIVKIGFNKFWMSKSLRATKPAKVTTDITEYIRYNADGKIRETIYEAIGGQSTGIDYPGTMVLPAGYVYPGGSVYENGETLQFDAWNSLTEAERNEGKIGLLYNTTAFKSGVLLPNDPDGTYDVEFITIDDIKQLRIYVGCLFSAKLMSSYIRTHNGTSYSESFHDAMRHNKMFHSTLKSFTPNVSGFNLRPGGIVSTDLNQPGEMGDQFAIFIDNGHNDYANGFSVFSFFCYDGWSTKKLSDYFLNSKFNHTFNDEASASRLFAQVRCVYSYKNQATSAPIVTSRRVSSPKRNESRIQKLNVVKSTARK